MKFIRSGWICMPTSAGLGNSGSSLSEHSYEAMICSCLCYARICTCCVAVKTNEQINIYIYIWYPPPQGPTFLKNSVVFAVCSTLFWALARAMKKKHFQGRFGSFRLDLFRLKPIQFKSGRDSRFKIQESRPNFCRES